MKNKLRDALMAGLKSSQIAGDSIGFLQFLRAYLMVQPKEERDHELIAALKNFTEGCK